MLGVARFVLFIRYHFQQLVVRNCFFLLFLNKLYKFMSIPFLNSSNTFCNTNNTFYCSSSYLYFCTFVFSNLHRLSKTVPNWNCLTTRRLVMSSVQTNVSFQNGVNGGNALQRALNEIDDYLLYLGTEHFWHVESTAPVIIASNIIFPVIINIFPFHFYFLS